MELKREIMNISDLCRLESDKLQICCLKSAQPLDVFVDNFAVMMRNSPNIFTCELKKKLKEALARVDTKITASDIFPQIWQPAFNFCLELLANLADQSMKLDFVDKHLAKFSETLLNDVRNLAEAISSCGSQCTPPIHELKLAVKKVQDYWRLCRYEDGARVFLQLRDVLNLKGDFSRLFSVQVNI